ncbi:MAG: hypothetical protein E4G98_03190 [Promethearchaeota archaeon]|nr:MAG: hypothetical protein E4G98_03190 [Candidatus Lokiarchaeota archaeon]
MTKKLWSRNRPMDFWQCSPPLIGELWEKAFQLSLPTLNLAQSPSNIDELLELTLGETRFGPDHWTLSLPKKIYYLLKPILPRSITRIFRKMYRSIEKGDPNTHWPIESRYVNFLWKIMANLLQEVPDHELHIKPFWPNSFRFSFVLTHDVETEVGQRYIRSVADLEESLGFRSSFNFVPEGYRIDMDLVDELRQRGFEVGIHGLKHDGKLYNSHSKFLKKAAKINRFQKEFGSVGFRSPLTLRNPYWMQSLDIEYDLSFFDTDPFEPIPGGTMSIWPFFIGRFVELPYTLVQDYTLVEIMGETTPRLWLNKVDFIEAHYGMALVNSHPDYLHKPVSLEIYKGFLTSMKERDGYWHALPRDVAHWWNLRNAVSSDFEISGHILNKVILKGNEISIVL